MMSMHAWDLHLSTGDDAILCSCCHQGWQPRASRIQGLQLLCADLSFQAGHLRDNLDTQQTPG